MKRVVEPVRKSLLGVVRKNVQAGNMVTYITRVIYIGAYTGAYSKLEETMELIIRDLQADYAKVPITGIFLVYPKYYIHILEMSEDIIYKHFKALRDVKSDEYALGRIVLLPFYHHVYQRLFTEWFHLYTIPPTLLDKPDSYELSEIEKQVSHCLEKVYVVCEGITSIAHDHSVSMKDVLRNMSDKISQLFPESTVLEYLLNVNTPVLLTVEKYLEIHSTVPFINLYQDSIWPPPKDFMFHCSLEKDSGPSVKLELAKDARPYGGYH